jgi:hypothetical protein
MCQRGVKAPLMLFIGNEQKEAQQWIGGSTPSLPYVSAELRKHVIPAQAGTQEQQQGPFPWVPTCAGMTWKVLLP